MTIKVKATLILLATLIIGGLIGGLIVGALARDRMQGMPPFGRDGFVDRWIGMLNPEAEQKHALEKIVERHAPRFRDTFTRHREEMQSLIDSLHQELDPVLTEAQREQLNRRRTRGQGRFMEGRRGRGPARGRRGAGPPALPPPSGPEL